MGEKIPYNPVEDKRYYISRDQFSQDRLHLIKESLYDRPAADFEKGVFGVTGYGSLAKGKILDSAEMAQNSDIDCGIFYDCKVLAQAIPELVRTNPEFTSIMRGYFEQRMREIQRDGLEKANPNERQWLEKISEKALNFGDFFDTYIADWEKYQFGHISDDNKYYTSKGFSRATNFPFAEAFSNYFYKTYLLSARQKAKELGVKKIDLAFQPYTYDIMMEQLEIAWRETPSYREVMDFIKFFSLDIGGGMRSMRRDFFSHLKERPDKEKIWQQMRLLFIRGERDGYISEKLQKFFPMDFSTAYKQYTGKSLTE